MKFVIKLTLSYYQGDGDNYCWVAGIKRFGDPHFFFFFACNEGGGRYHFSKPGADAAVALLIKTHGGQGWVIEAIGVDS
jgi:hypothetical protein